MQADKPLLSILIPTRNRGRYLKYAIQSALNIQSNDVEIIVSENYGSDDGWEVANSFSDPRMEVLRPNRPLPMHENWEFLLSRASGRWITFIGDDDAVMPHCAVYLSFLDSRFPEAEAIVTPRAYYFWEEAYNASDISKCSFELSHKEVWRDSKKALDLCLTNKVNYLSLPQIYSGGFHRYSLVQRVIRLQGGHYFRSVTPDAYSAVVATLHTYRYLEVGVPMTWVGTSPSSKTISSAKDRDKDFHEMHSESFSMSPCLGDKCQSWTFLIYFFEAYISAAPFVDLRELSWARIRKIYGLAARELFLRGDRQGSIDLALSLGMDPVNPDYFGFYQSMQMLNRLFRWTLKACTASMRRLPVISRYSLDISLPFRRSYVSSGDQCPNILASDSVLSELFNEYRSMYIATEETNIT